MVQIFGRWGRELYELCRGEDDRPVEPNRIRKSLSNECTYSQNLKSLGACENAIDELIADLQDELQQKASLRQIRKAFVKVKFADFSRTTKECLSHAPTREVFHALLREAYSRKQKDVRLLGVGVRFEDQQDQAANQILMPF
jgi:DNA polymerase-4